MSRAYQQLRARLILRLVRAAVTADVLSEFTTELFPNIQAFIERINRDADFRRELLTHPAVQAALDEMDNFA